MEAAGDGPYEDREKNAGQHRKWIEEAREMEARRREALTKDAKRETLAEMEARQERDGGLVSGLEDAIKCGDAATKMWEARLRRVEG